MAIKEPGEYVAVAEKFDFGKSKNDNDYIEVVFKVVEGDCEGSYITWRGFLTDAAAPFTLKSLRYAGWSGDALGEDMTGLGDTKVRLVVEENEWEDKVFMRVRWVNKVALKRNFGAQNPLHGDDFSSLNARLSMKIKEVPIEECVKAEGATQAQRIKQDSLEGDNLPF